MSNYPEMFGQAVHHNYDGSCCDVFAKHAGTAVGPAVDMANTADTGFNIGGLDPSKLA